MVLMPAHHEDGAGKSTATRRQFGEPLRLSIAGDRIQFDCVSNLRSEILPSTWLMLLSGFLGLDFFAYLGTRKSSAALAAT